MKFVTAFLLMAVSAQSVFAQASLDEVLDLVSDINPDVVFLGEVHDNPTHHANQHAIASALSPAAIVFEMITAEQAEAVTQAFTEGAQADLRALLDWDNSGWPDFDFYAPLFELAENARIYGALVDRSSARAAFDAGAARAFQGDAARFGLDQPLATEEQATREAEQLAAHCDALPVDILPAFVEAQRLRDAVLAQEVLRALDEVGGPVVVITGNGHARLDIGAPRLVLFAAPSLLVFSLGQTEDGFTPSDGLYDAWLSAQSPVRDDPCAAFR